MARPRKEFDSEVFEKLCQLQCTEVEISHWFDMCEDTLNTRVLEVYGEGFSETYKKHSDEGKMSLRRTQFRHAETNVAMAIFLGKQYLGQRDVDAFIDQSQHRHITIVKFGEDGQNTGTKAAGSRVSGINTPVAEGGS